jgi:hypothetical protein
MHGGLKWTGFGFDQLITCPHSGTARSRAWLRLVSRLERLHSQPFTPHPKVARYVHCSHAAESGKTHLWRPSLPDGRRTESVMRVALGVHAIPLLTTVAPPGDCLCADYARRSSHEQRSFKRQPIATQMRVSVALARISCGTKSGAA